MTIRHRFCRIRNRNRNLLLSSLLILTTLLSSSLAATTSMSTLSNQRTTTTEPARARSANFNQAQGAVQGSWVRNTTRAARPLLIGPAQITLSPMSNWAGYVYYGTKVTYVEGSWSVPTVYGSCGLTGCSNAISTWVGIGGISSSSNLIQTGTGWDCFNRLTNCNNYYAWFEIVYPPNSPDKSHCSDSGNNNCAPQKVFGVSAGDAIFAEVTFNSQNSWTIHIKDFNNGQDFQKVVTFYSGFDAAEWISAEEVTCVGSGCSGSYFPLAPFDAFVLTNCSATDNGQTKMIGAWPSDSLEVDIIGPSSGPDTYVFRLSYPYGLDTFSTVYKTLIPTIHDYGLGDQSSSSPVGKSESAYQGSTISGFVQVNNPTSVGLTMILGMSIQDSSCTNSDCSNPPNDQQIGISSGLSGWQKRLFQIQPNFPTGTKKYALAIWTDSPPPGPGVFIASTGWVDSITINSCSYSIIPQSANYGSSGGSGSVSVTAQSGCSWTAVSNNADWITVTSGSSGSGNGQVGYSVSANPNTNSRQGTITIAGQTFTVDEAGTSPTCATSIQPLSGVYSGVIVFTASTSNCVGVAQVTYIYSTDQSTWYPVGSGTSSSNGWSYSWDTVSWGETYDPSVWAVAVAQDASGHDLSPWSPSTGPFSIDNRNQYTLTVVAGSGGTTSPSPGQYQHYAGDSISVSYSITGSGYTFAGWTVSGGVSCSGGSMFNPCTFTMPSNAVTVTANFNPPQPTIVLDTHCDGRSATGQTTCTLTLHAANVLVVIVAASASSTVTVSSVTVGSTSAVLVQKVAQATSPATELELWAAYITAPGTDIVTVNFSSSTARNAIAVASFTGTANNSPVTSDFENTQTNKGNGNSAQTISTAITPGHSSDFVIQASEGRSSQATSGTNSFAISVGSSQTDIDKNTVATSTTTSYALGVDLNCYSSGSACASTGTQQTMSATYTIGNSNPISTATIVTAILASAQPSFDFSVSNSGPIAVKQGNSGSNTITVTLLTSSPQTVTLSCTSPLPTGVTCSFNPLSALPSFSSTLTVSTSSSTPIGTYMIGVQGTGGGLTRPGGGFSLYVGPLVTLSATSGSPGSAVIVAAYGFDPTDTGCTISSSPTGLISNPTCTISSLPSGVWVTGSFVIASGASGSYTVTVAGTPVGDVASASFTVSSTPTTVIMTVSYSVVGGGSPTAPVFHYVLGGVSQSYTLTKTATAKSVDAGSPWSVTPATGVLVGSSSSTRWYLTPSSLTGTASTTTIVFAFQHQYYLTMKVLPSSAAGSVTPGNGWHNAGQTFTITATQKPGHTFKSWTGTGTGNYTGTSKNHTITMNSAITETANFT